MWGLRGSKLYRRVLVVYSCLVSRYGENVLYDSIMSKKIKNQNASTAAICLILQSVVICNESQPERMFLLRWVNAVCSGLALPERIVKYGIFDGFSRIAYYNFAV